MRNMPYLSLALFVFMALLTTSEYVKARPGLTPQEFFTAVKDAYLSFDEERAKKLIAEYNSQGIDYKEQILSIRKLVEPVGVVPRSVEKECATTIKTIDHTKHRVLAESVVKQYPNCEYAWIWLGMLNEDQQMEKAAECYRRALAIAPNNIAAHIMLLGVYRATGDMSSYRLEYKKLVLLKPDRYAIDSEIDK